MSKQIAFKAGNHHDKVCGKPPMWASQDSEPGHRRFYGESELGVQMAIDVSVSLFRMALGDVGWPAEVRVERPDYHMLLNELDATRGFVGFQWIVLGATERALVRAALMTGTKLVRPHNT